MNPDFVQCDFNTPCPFGGSADSSWYQIDGYPDEQIWSQSVGTATTPGNQVVNLHQNTE